MDNITKDEIIKNRAEDILEKVEKTEESDNTEIAAGVVETGAMLIPGFAGAGISGILSGVSSSHRLHKKLDGLVEIFRDDLAVKFNVSPDQVTPQHVLAAANSNKALHQEIRVISEKKNFAPAKVTVSILSGLACGGLVGSIIPGLNILFIPVGMIAGSIIGGLASDKVVDKITEASAGYDKEGTPIRMVQRIIDKQASGEHINPADTLRIKAALVSDLSRAIKASAGKEFYDLSDASLLGVMAKFDGNLFNDMNHEAKSINNGMRPQCLIFEQSNEIAKDDTPEITKQIQSANPLALPKVNGNQATNNNQGWVERVSNGHHKEQSAMSFVEREKARRDATDNQGRQGHQIA